MTRKKVSGMHYLMDDGKWVNVPMPVCPDCGETLNVYAFDNNPYVKCECDNCKTSTTVHTLDMQNRARILLVGKE